MSEPRWALGLDFGTESVRAVVVDLRGRVAGEATAPYRHGQLTERLPGSDRRLPPQFALQHPLDWLDSAAEAVRAALIAAAARPADVLGLGVDFTSCTMLPTRRDGAPLCLVDRWAREPYAWPKLWKHHGALEETERINRLARARNEPWLARYGGAIGLEWFFPKVLETLTHAPEVYAAAEVWLEAGDWLVWQLVGGPAETLTRSTCQAGYKAMWSRQAGYPSAEFLAALDPRWAGIVAEKLPGVFRAPGERAGLLTGPMAARLGLIEGMPVSTATIDAHAGVPGAGVAEPGTLVMVLGTSSCHMLNARAVRPVPGVAGIVEDGILPGLVGYETGQAAVGDAFDWARRLTGVDYARLAAEAAALPPGAEGVLAVDWLHGCRTPLMNGGLRGAVLGLSLAHGPAHLFRALIEASACGVRWIVDLLREHGVPVDALVATGGLPHYNPLLVEIYADVLGQPIRLPAVRQGPALGAAILGVVAAGHEATGFASVAEAVRALAGADSAAGREARVVEPQRAHTAAYDDVYARYRAAAAWLAEGPAPA